MTPHPLVTQLRFTRGEWVRGLRSVTPDEAARRFGPINPIAWMIGHLAWQEQRYFVELAQGTVAVPEVKSFGFGKPLAVPALDEAWRWWRAVSTAADVYLDTVSGAMLTRPWKRDRSGETPGTRLHRTTYHYWFHLGESQAVRQLLGHTKLPTFVGGFGKSQYRAEP
jgi:DinB family protein